MLERCYARPKTVDRIRSSWLGAAIEQYATWFLERGHAPKDLGCRVPILLRFGTFAYDRGARRYAVPILSLSGVVPNRPQQTDEKR